MLTEMLMLAYMTVMIVGGIPTYSTDSGMKADKVKVYPDAMMIGDVELSAINLTPTSMPYNNFVLQMTLSLQLLDN